MRGRALAAVRTWATAGGTSPPAAAATAPCWARGFASNLPDDLLPKVAIVGRPNVGKSALFNRLVRRREALVHDTPGGHVTRDYQESPAQLGDLRFLAVDTSGLEPYLPGGGIQARASALTARVLRRADVALLLLDGRAGVLPPDEALARWLRASAHAGRVLVVANKCERRGREGEAGVGEALAEAARLGFGAAVAVSAESGEGMAELYEALRPRLDPLREARAAAVDEVARPVGGGDAEDAVGGDGEGGGGGAATRGARRGRRGSEGSAQQAQQGSGGPEAAPLKIAIMGLTNVGKSTLANWLLQEERCLTGPEPGLTRDAIKVRLTHGGRAIEVVDTAGWVRRARLAAHDDAGGAVAARTLEEGRSVLRFVHVVVLVVDAARGLEHGEGMTHQESALASHAVAEGRCLVILANKLDALPPERAEQALALVRRAAEAAVPDARGLPVLGASALTGRGADALLPAALAMYDTWTRRVPTSGLNRWLEGLAAARRHGGGSDLRRVKYVSQVKARPPTFVAFVSGAAPLPEASRRFLANQLREGFGFGGVPLRITVRNRQRTRPPRR